MIYRFASIIVLTILFAVPASAQDAAPTPEPGGIGVIEPPCAYTGPGDKELANTFGCINRMLVALRDGAQALREENDRLRSDIASLRGDTASIRGVLSWLQDQVAMVHGVAVEAKTVAVSLQPAVSTLVDDVWRLQQTWAQFGVAPALIPGSVSTDPEHDGGGDYARCPAGSFISAVQIYQFPPPRTEEHEIRAYCSPYPVPSQRP